MRQAPRMTRLDVGSRIGVAAVGSGLRMVGTLVSTLLRAPFALLGSLTGDPGSVAAPTAQSKVEPTPPKDPAITDLNQPLVALVALAIRALESAGVVLGGRASTAGFLGPPETDAGAAPTARHNVLLAPAASLIYVVRDLVATYRRGIVNTARRRRS